MHYRSALCRASHSMLIATVISFSYRFLKPFYNGVAKLLEDVYGYVRPLCTVQQASRVPW